MDPPPVSGLKKSTPGLNKRVAKPTEACMARAATRLREYIVVTTRK
jgi:hypothetical protein